MNKQTSGPLCGSDFDATQICKVSGPMILQVSDWLGTSDEGCATAILARNAYNSFDKAGRRLGVDAGQLAERLDLAELIETVQTLENSTFKPGEEEIRSLRKSLRKILEKAGLYDF